MRSTISLAAALALAAALVAACNPQDGSAPATDSAAQKTTPTNAGPARPAATVPAGQNAEPSDGVRRITVAEARAAVERGEAIIYDVRDKKAFADNHIKGAKLVPLAEVGARAAEFPKDKLIITYCA